MEQNYTLSATQYKKMIELVCEQNPEFSLLLEENISITIVNNKSALPETIQKKFAKYSNKVCGFFTPKYNSKTITTAGGSVYLDVIRSKYLFGSMSNTLIHELLHALLYVQDKAYDDNAPLFVREAMRIGSLGANGLNVPCKDYNFYQNIELEEYLLKISEGREFSGIFEGFSLDD